MNEKYDIFISYRRDGGESTAKMLHDKLESLGYRVFFDVESLRSGNFNTALYSMIDECRDFLLVLSPGALDRCQNEDDWVRLEIEHALEQGLNIVPIMLRGFSFPDELPQSIDRVRYKNGIESSYQFFDAFIDKLQTYLASERSGVKRRRKRTLVTVAVAVLLCIALFIWFVVGGQSGGYPRTSHEIQAVDDFISYVEKHLQQYEQVFEYMDKSYQACNEYMENSYVAGNTALLAELSDNRRGLEQLDVDSSRMSADLRDELKDSPIQLSDANAMHDYLVINVQNSIDTLDILETLVDDDSFVDAKNMKAVVEDYQEILDVERDNIAYCTNELFLGIENQEVLEDFKYTFLPTLYYVRLSASNWSNDRKSLESDIEKSLAAIEKVRNRTIARVGNDNLKVMMVKSGMIQQLVSEGAAYDAAEMAVEDIMGEIQLAVEKEENEDLTEQLEERAREEVKKYSDMSEKERKEWRERHVPGASEDEGKAVLWGKMVRYLDMGLYDEAIACVNAYYTSVQNEPASAITEYAEDYCAAAVRFIQNIDKTGIDYGAIVIGYSPNNPNHNEQYMIGDVVIAVDGVPCHSADEYTRFRKERTQGQDFTVVVLREDEESPGQLKQVELKIPGNAPRVMFLHMTNKEY